MTRTATDGEETISSTIFKTSESPSDECSGDPMMSVYLLTVALWGRPPIEQAVSLTSWFNDRLKERVVADFL